MPPRNDALAAVNAIHTEAADRDRAPDRRREQAAKLLKDARKEAQSTRAAARADAQAEAREIVVEAYAVAREVQQQGTTVSRNLRELSASLRNNAERLLRDVRLTHGSMTARLDQVAAGEGPRDTPSRSRPYGEADSDSLEVPELVPRG
jgi:hypothetical protein